MIAVDASLLLYAVNRYAPEHPRAAAVLEDLANGDLPWALPWPSVHEFLKFVTHPHAVARPLSPEEAWAFIESLRTSASLRMLAPSERHGGVLEEVIGGLAAGPPATAGLETAVLLREHGIRELLSSDRGMRRFAFLSVTDPLHGEPWTPTGRPVRRYRVLRRPPRGSAR